MLSQTSHRARPGPASLLSDWTVSRNLDQDGKQNITCKNSVLRLFEKYGAFTYM